MTDKDKQQYEAKATKDKERYEAEKRAYHVTPPPSYVVNALVGLNYDCPSARKSIKTSLFL